MFHLALKNYIKYFNISFEERQYDLFHSAVSNYFDEKKEHIHLKLQAITQLGYSRGGTNACLPDELIEQIKTYVFYNLHCDSIQQQKALSMMKQYTLLFRTFWKMFRSFPKGFCDCDDCFHSCWNGIVECTRRSIVKYCMHK